MLTSETPVISMRNVSHYYGTGTLRRQVLFDLTCDILPGEIVIITGPSSSGKTTVLTLVGALRSVQHGSIRILGQELNGASHDTSIRVRESVGFIFQAHNLLDSLTAAQNVEIALDDNRLSRRQLQAQSVAMLETVGLGQRIHHFPNQLSGGERQRVAIARALARHPKIVLADEPTASLDKTSGREIVELLRQLARRQGCAVLLVTHDNRILDIADRLMTLEEGRLESFSPAPAPDATHLLTVLAHAAEKDQLRMLLESTTEGDFIDLLNTLGGEVEQLLNVLNLGGREPLRMLLRNLMETFLAKVSVILSADGAGLWDHHRGELRVLVEPHASPKLALAIEALETKSIVNRCGPGLGVGVESVLCVPIRNRLDEILAIVGIVNKKSGPAFTDADERAFRDFSVPLGIIVEGWRRLANEETLR